MLAARFAVHTHALRCFSAEEQLTARLLSAGRLLAAEPRSIEMVASVRARRLAVLYLSLIVAGLSLFADTLNNIAGVLILTAALLFGFPRAGRSSLASVVVVTGVAFNTMPYLGLYYVGYDVQTAWFALFLVVSLTLVTYAEPSRPASTSPSHGVADLPLVAIYLVAGLLLWSTEGLRQIAFYAGWAMALLHLERLHAGSRSLVLRGLGLFAFLSVIGYFVLTLWEGGGRIVQLSFALGPVLLTVHYRTFRLNGWVLAAVIIVLSFVGRVLRFGWGDGLAGLAEDSGAAPITLTSYLWTTKDVVRVVDTIFDQWVLFFFNWVPRDLWPTKPLGIGSTFVDMVLGREGVSAEHNIAIGFFGEHLFYLPYAWPLSAGLLVLAIIATRRGLWVLCAPYYSALIVFDVWLMTLFWGGMAAFAARAWFALLPLIPYVLFIKWLDRQRSAHGRPPPGRRDARRGGRDPRA